MRLFEGHNVSRTGRASSVLLVLVIGFLLAPSILCAFPSGMSSAADHDCCEKMKRDCGKANMSACCETVSPTQALVAPDVIKRSVNLGTAAIVVQFSSLPAAAALLPTTVPVGQTETGPPHEL